MTVDFNELLNSFQSYYFEMMFCGFCAGVFIGGFGLACKSVINIFNKAAK
jgi:hypothetical protein